MVLPSGGKLYFKYYLRESFHIRLIEDATGFILNVVACLEKVSLPI